MALARSRDLALPGLAAMLAAGAMLQGAFYPSQLGLALAVGMLAALAARATLGDRVVGWALGVLAVGMLASTIATGFDARAAKPAATLALAAVAFALGRSVERRESRAAVLDLVVAVGALVAVPGLIGIGLGLASWALPADTWRLTSTLTYQNAAGSVLALALIPALVRARTGVPHAFAATAVVAALAGTLSRGAFLAAAGAVVVTAVLSSEARRSIARAAPAGVIAAVAVVPAVLGLAWAWLPLVAGLALATVLMRAVPPRAIARATLALIALAVVLAAAAGPLRDRFTLSSTDRARVWSATLERVDEHLAFGTGPGTFELIAPAGDRIVRTAHAHNEYLQVLAETGVVGLAAVLIALGLFVRAAARGARLVGEERALWAAAVAACVVVVIHAGFDFVWRVPIVVALGFVMLAAASASKEGT